MKDPVKSIAPNDHLADTISNMLNNHDKKEDHPMPHDHFSSVTNHHPHSGILDEMRKLLEENHEAEDEKILLVTP